MSARNPDLFALETHGLSRNFGHFKAVTNVSLQIPVGARHALIGPNGAGKTTLVNVISGQLGPSSGRISVLGKDVTARSQRGRVQAALCRTFQVNQLFVGLTVLENVLAADQSNAIGCSAHVLAPHERTRCVPLRGRRSAHHSSSSTPSATDWYANCPTAGGGCLKLPLHSRPGRKC